MSWAQGLARGACRTAAETLKREPEPVASPAAARFGGSLLSTPLGPKVYSEAAAPHGGSCVHAAWPRSRRLRALTLYSRSWVRGCFPAELGFRTLPPPLAGARADPSRSGAVPEPRWPPALGGGSVSPPAPRPQPGISSLPSPGPKTHCPRPASPYLKTPSRWRVRASVRVSLGPCRSVCALGALHAPKAALEQRAKDLATGTPAASKRYGGPRRTQGPCRRPRASAGGPELRTKPL